MTVSPRYYDGESLFRTGGWRDRLCTCRRAVASLAAFLGELGREVDQLTGRELRRLEPALGPDVRGGLCVPGDLAVDNRAFLAALQAACERIGVPRVAWPDTVLTDGARVEVLTAVQGG